jgi:hypothetical protein
MDELEGGDSQFRFKGRGKGKIFRRPQKKILQFGGIHFPQSRDPADMVVSLLGNLGPVLP